MAKTVDKRGGFDNAPSAVRLEGLLGAEDLARSSVVANCAMNRERRLTGSNGYQRDLGQDILAFLRSRRHKGPATWFDLCCGTGRALIEAAREIAQDQQAAGITIEGVDLAGMFDPNPFPRILTLIERAAEDWTPAARYALITCVHGLHYVGDKLGLIEKAVRCLLPGGLLAANLDLGNFRFLDGRPAGRTVAARLRANGLSYDTRRRLVRCEGPRVVNFGLRYLGADDTAGPNYTGQAAVASYYSGGST